MYSGEVQSFDCWFQLDPICDQVETAFRRYLFAFFRNETDFIGHKFDREIDDLRRVRHLEVQLRDDVGAQPLKIAIQPASQ